MVTLMNEHDLESTGLPPVEFCLFLEHIHGVNPVQLAQRVAQLFNEAYVAGDNTLHDSEVETAPLIKNHKPLNLNARPCCHADKSADDHTEHHVVISVTTSALRSYAALLRPDTPPQSEAMKALLQGLTPGQLAWLCDLIVRSAHMRTITLHPIIAELKGVSQGELDNFAGPGKKHRSRITGNLILSLQRAGLVSELIICHNAPQRAELQEALVGFNWKSVTSKSAPELKESSSGDKCDDATCIDEKPTSEKTKNRGFQSRLMFPDVSALRSYLGDGVGIYFAWMKSYVVALVWLALLGIILFISNDGTSEQVVQDVEDNDEPEYVGEYKLPLRRRCMRLSGARAFFGLAAVIWALICSKLWSRERATNASNWTRGALLDSALTWQLCSRGHGDLRAQFRGQWRCSRVTGSPELYYPARLRRLRYLVTGTITMICVSIALSLNVALMNLEGFIHPSRSATWLHIASLASWAAPGEIFDPKSPSWWAYLPGIIHPLAIFFMNQIVFRHIAEALTNWENQKTRRAYEKSLVLKRFLFEAIDAYACLAYLGLILGDWFALQSLLLSMFATDSLRRIILESVIPYLSYRMRCWFTSRRVSETAAQKKKNDNVDDDSDSEKHAKKLLRRREMCADNYETFDDYLEMVLEHGYLVLFATALPASVPLIALVCTWAEAHFDAFKLLWVTRRPEPRALPPVSTNSGMHVSGGKQPTDTWLMLLQVQAWLSIVTNVGLIVCGWYGCSLSSINVTAMNEDWWWWGVALEHILLAVGLIIEFGISNVPVQVRDRELIDMYKNNQRLATMTH